MSAKKFKFVSPGIFLNEIDNSQLPREANPIGPMVIGRSLRGPAMRPIQVTSFAEFVEYFGAPHPGGEGTDIWRNGNTLAPTYAAYAAQAWLKNSSTLNFIRLLGKEHTDRTADTAGQAGWGTSQNNALIYDSAHGTGGGAYGLFVFHPSMGPTDEKTTATGQLAAIWYVDSGSMALIGDDTSGSAAPQNLSGAAALIQSDAEGNFTALIQSGESSTAERFTFNLDTGHRNYIRKVFNTNPTKINSDISHDTEAYFLGETYENVFAMDYDASEISSSGAPSLTGKYVGVILGLESTASTADRHGQRRIAFEQQSNNPQTGWYVSQHLADKASYDFTSLQKLFKFHGLDHGEWVQNNIKISITNLRYSKDDFDKYGSFDVLVRDIKDTDKAPVVLERFSNCNLNPNSLDYIGRKIGTQYVTFDTNERILKAQGEYINNSKYIRVQMNVDVDLGSTNEEFLPFGVYGPIKYHDFTVDDGTAESRYLMAKGGGSAGIITRTTAEDTLGGTFISGSDHKLLTCRFPKVPLRLSASQDSPSSNKEVYFGAWTGKTKTNPRFNEDIRDLVRTKAETLDQFTAGSQSEYMWQFSLHEISSSGDGVHTAGVAANDMIYATGSYMQGLSITTSSYKALVDLDLSNFTTVFAGGSDGFDITEAEPFRNSSGGAINGKTEKTGYAYNSVKEAVDIIRDTEFAEFNVATIPGLQNEGLTTHLIDTVEKRADALAIIDLKGDFLPAHEGSNGKTYGEVDATVSNLKNRGLNSSYACAYYPYVQIRDTITGRLVYMPPSVAALGAMSYTDRVRAPWFAPAGFNRGGLSSGVAGLPVVNVTQKLTARERDKLYEANINPIASFPSEGIVIFGQKTLQVTRSALDRINVRRLMIFVKKGISTISADILFEPNVQETWDRFVNRAGPFLADVKAQFGLTDYKLVLDKTTTTDDLIDQNILYAKVFLKPARAIEFIAVDFIVTNTGAAFED